MNKGRARLKINNIIATLLQGLKTKIGLFQGAILLVLIGIKITGVTLRVPTITGTNNMDQIKATGDRPLALIETKLQAHIEVILLVLPIETRETIEMITMVGEVGPFTGEVGTDPATEAMVGEANRDTVIMIGTEKVMATEIATNTDKIMGTLTIDKIGLAWLDTNKYFKWKKPRKPSINKNYRLTVEINKGWVMTAISHYLPQWY